MANSTLAFHATQDSHEPVPAFAGLTEDVYNRLTAELELLRRLSIQYTVLGYKDPDDSPAYISEPFPTYAQAEHHATTYGAGLIIHIETHRSLTVRELQYAFLRPLAK